MIRRLCAVVLVGLMGLVPVCRAEGVSASRPIWLVITRPMFVDALKPLVQLRQKQGFETVVSTEAPELAIKTLSRAPSFIVIVGDFEQGKADQPWYVSSKLTDRFCWMAGQRTDFATDALLGDTDGDKKPDVPVGRIPARSPKQVQAVVNKILIYEKSPVVPDSLRLPIWAGSPCYTPEIDAMATKLMLTIFQGNAPRWSELWAISADPLHPLCGWPVDHPELYSRQLQRGGLVSVMVGHASVDSFFSMLYKDGAIGYTAAHADRYLTSGKPGGTLVILSCSNGEFESSKPCLGESLLYMPGGPVVVIAATSESHPLTNTYTGISLLKHLKRQGRRVGEFWVNVQKDAFTMRNFVLESILKNVEGKLGASSDLVRMRQDHLLMYAVLGDPATRVPLPYRLASNVTANGKGWQWKANKPEDATELHVYVRPLQQPVQRMRNGLAQQAARQRFKETNAKFAFKRIAVLSAKEDWSGTVNTPGTLRLIAIAPGKSYVAAADLNQIASGVSVNLSLAGGS